MRTHPEFIEFEWDEGNFGKNKKHHIEDFESEEVFFDENKVTFRDHLHSDHEERFRILGKTRKRKLLFVVFTKRGNRIRIISARTINKKELPLYEKTIKNS